MDTKHVAPTKKLSLLFITGTHSHGGGAEAVLSDLVNHLDPQKCDITIQEIMRYHVDKTKTRECVKINKTPLLDTKFPLKLFNEQNKYLINYNPRVLAALFSLNDYEAAVAWNGEKSSCLLYGVSARDKIGWFHSSIEDLDVTRHPQMKERNALLRRAWSTVRKIVTISRMSLQSLKDLYPQYIDKALIIHNMCDTKEIIDRANEEKIDFGAGKHIIAMGRLEKRKNFGLLIEAVKVLKDENVFVTLHILGSGDELQNLTDLAKGAGVSDRVIFHGFIANPLPYIKASCVMCISSTNEGWPTVATEAMTLGVPFVTTKVAGSSDELANNGECGLVSGWEANDYAKKIKTLISDDALYSKMSKAGVEHVKEYSPNKTVEAFEALLDSGKENNRDPKEGKNTPKDSKGSPVCKMNRAKAFVLYVFYSVFSVARVRQAFWGLKKAKGQKTLFGRRLPFIVRLAIVFCALVVVIFTIPILLVPRLIATVIYLVRLSGAL